jgi:DNA recombination protein RmuC
MIATIITSLLALLLALAIAKLLKQSQSLSQQLADAATQVSEARIENTHLNERLSNTEAENQRRLSELNEEKTQLTHQLSETRIENARLNERLKNVEVENQRRLNELNEEKARLAREAESRFQNLANGILEENSRKFKEQNETRLNEILTPLRDNIEQFKKTVTDAYSAEARERFSLQERIRELVETNRSIGKEAKDLSEALRGNSKIQGDWGEMILETILEKSGLKRDTHFSVQLTTDANGNTLRDASGHALRPDVVINYPDGRCVVIDSKVSLTAYVNMVNADNPAEAEAYGRQHLASIKAHIKELSEKNYQEYVGDKKTDFVMMFIPNEAAYMVAMNLDANLWQEAYDRRVLIISPTHLISAVRLIEQLWRQDDMKRNVVAIAEESGKMYDKFVGFVDDMTKIEKSLDSTRTAYDSAMKKLKTGSGNLIRKAENLRKMGAKTSKQLNPALNPDDDTDAE